MKTYNATRIFSTRTEIRGSDLIVTIMAHFDSTKSRQLMVILSVLLVVRIFSSSDYLVTRDCDGNVDYGDDPGDNNDSHETQEQSLRPAILRRILMWLKDACY